jgi:hypothetical protein
MCGELRSLEQVASKSKFYNLNPALELLCGFSLAVIGLLFLKLWIELGILAMLLSIIPLGRMMMLMRAGDDTSRGFELYLGSFMVSIVICTVVGVTAFGAFCLSLFGVCTLGGSTMGGDFGALVVYGITGLSVIVVCMPLGRWVIRRWKRDSE